MLRVLTAARDDDEVGQLQIGLGPRSRVVVRKGVKREGRFYELSVVGSEGRWSWELLGRNRVDAPTYAAALAQAIRTRQRWRAEYDAAKTAAAGARAGPAPPEAA